MERFSKWTMSDRKGHPLLSLRQSHVSGLCDAIPMLVGTSAKKGKLLIHVEDDKTTDFATHVESQLIFAKDFLYHASGKKIEDAPDTPIWERRRLWPNFGKQRITDEEDKRVRDFLGHRKMVALEQGG